MSFFWVTFYCTVQNHTVSFITEVSLHAHVVVDRERGGLLPSNIDNKQSIPRLFSPFLMQAQQAKDCLVACDDYTKVAAPISEKSIRPHLWKAPSF